MIQIDLITGFLGAGKTTFIQKYASYWINQGQRIGIIENDFGAVNVDMMLLEYSLGEQVSLEMIAGGSDQETHQRRYKTKLIAMKMQGFDRIIVEPSGIYDVDEFFDVLYESPIDEWYEIGNVIAIVDAKLSDDLSKASNYLLASQIANAGKVVFSKTQETSKEQMLSTVEHMNTALTNVQCKRQFTLDEILTTPWEEWKEEDYQSIAHCGYLLENFRKRGITDKDYSTLYLMNIHIHVSRLKEAIEEIMNDEECGKVFRIKGFINDENQWIEVNATKEEIVIEPIAIGQEIIIVIGEQLVENNIRKHLK